MQCHNSLVHFLLRQLFLLLMWLQKADKQGSSVFGRYLQVTLAHFIGEMQRHTLDCSYTLLFNVLGC